MACLNLACTCVYALTGVTDMQITTGITDIQITEHHDMTQLTVSYNAVYVMTDENVIENREMS